MEKKTPSLDEILANLERASWQSYIRSKSLEEAESRAPRVKIITQSNAVAEAAGKIDERINELVSDHKSLLPGNPRREEIADEISRLRVLLASLNKTNA